MAKEQGQSGKTGILLYSAWFVSLVAMLGSLYFSEVQGFIPCELCWYQRIAMYPLVLILGIATFTKGASLRFATLPFGWEYFRSALLGTKNSWVWWIQALCQWGSMQLRIYQLGRFHHDSILGIDCLCFNHGNYAITGI
ncbi:disulfide bond formation protein B [Planococcus sp. A6]|uniref:disulfide bond formation protein B n=1 Tax=Planococcus sp. A6 TaxID=2992760 RepID=UPI00237AF63C|nr:disulfide bond formation protein B [Planococcus sp. A6]MDE0584452.1 disulfide bond formation protein B [Planococcus sp. A6]